MTHLIRRFSFLFLLSLSLAACTTMNDPSASKGMYDDKISSALDRAAGEAGRQGSSAGSLILLERVYKRDPQNGEAAVKFAKALRDSGDLQKAALVLEPFANGKDATSNILSEFAALQLANTQYSAAETYARKAIAKDQDAYNAYQILGISLDAQTKYVEAETAFRQALEKWQGDPIPVMNNLALNLTNQERLDEAVAIMEKAKETAPNRIEVERNLRIIRTLNESASGRPAPKPIGKPSAQ